MNPKQFPASTVTLPSWRPKPMAVASVSGEAVLDLTVSRSGMTFAGEKKCMPHTLGFREAATVANTLSMSRVDVLVASVASGLATASTADHTACLASRFS